MSRGYRVSWVTVGRTASASDSVKLPVALLGILSAGEMTALLQAELDRAGWKKGKDGARSTTIEGVTVRLDPAGSELTLVAEETREVEARATILAEAERLADAAAVRAAEQIRGAPAKRLTRAEGEVRSQLGEAVQRVYREALCKKAAALGEVQSVEESRGPDGEHEIVIKVRT